MEKITNNLFCGTNDFVSYNPSTSDYIITFIAIALVVLAFFLSVKYIIKPGEKNKDHVKYTIIDND